MFQRPIGATLASRLKEPRRFLQALAGPRQTGKTTLVRQIIEALPMPGHYAWRTNRACATAPGSSNNGSLVAYG